MKHPWRSPLRIDATANRPPKVTLQAAKEQKNKARPQDAVRIANRADDQMLEKTEYSVLQVFVARARPEGVDFRQTPSAFQLGGARISAGSPGWKKPPRSPRNSAAAANFAIGNWRCTKRCRYSSSDMVGHGDEVAQRGKPAPEFPILSELERRVEAVHGAGGIAVLMQMAPQTMKFFATRWRKVSLAGNSFQRKSALVESSEPSSAIRIVVRKTGDVLRDLGPASRTMPAQRIPQQDIVGVEKENVRRVGGGKPGISRRADALIFLPKYSQAAVAEKQLKIFAVPSVEPSSTTISSIFVRHCASDAFQRRRMNFSALYAAITTVTVGDVELGASGRPVDKVGASGLWIRRVQAQAYPRQSGGRMVRSRSFLDWLRRE